MAEVARNTMRSTFEFTKNETGDEIDQIDQLDSELDEIENSKKELEQKFADALAKKKDLADKLAVSQEAEKKVKIEALRKRKSELERVIAVMSLRAEKYTAKADIDEAFSEIDNMKVELEAINQNLNEAVPPSRIDTVAVIEPSVKLTWIERTLTHTGTLGWALGFLVAFGGVMKYLLWKTGQEIAAVNKLAEELGGATVPPSLTYMSAQQMYYSGMLMVAVFLLGIILLGLLAPAQLFFILPFTDNSKIEKWKDFNAQEEWQKQWQSFAYLFGILYILTQCIAKVGNA